MARELEIFVEGNDDKVFISYLLRHLQIPDVLVSGIGGGVEKLHLVRNQIRRSYDKGRRIALILDADSNFEERRNRFGQKKVALALPIADDDFFLIPNHRDDGTLETLLRELAVEDHQAIYDCLGRYHACLHEANQAYCGVPEKGQVYAYCEALGIEPNPKDRKYDDRSY